MAFSIFGFQFNRGITTANAQGQAFTAVPHTYKSNVDTLAQIAAPGYFPANFEPGVIVSDKVFVHDWLFIVDKNGATSFVNITGLNPVTLSADLFIATGLTVVAPTPATDTNGIIISGTNVQLEFADATHPGILSAAAQVIGGSKSFPAGIKANLIDGLNPADMMFIGNNQTATITIGGALANVLMTGLVTDNISNVAAAGTLNIHTVYDGVTIIGQDTASAITGILTNRINPITPGGHPLIIGNASVFPVEIGTPTAPILAKGGVKWDIGGGTITSYEQQIITFNWTGPWAGNESGAITLNKFENIVYMTSTRVPPAASTNNTFATSGAIIPPAFRPASQVEYVAQNVDNSAFVVGSIVVTTGGTVNAFGNAQQGSYAAAGNAGVGSINLSWSVV